MRRAQNYRFSIRRKNIFQAVCWGEKSGIKVNGMEKQAKKVTCMEGEKICDIVGTLEPINYNFVTRCALCFLLLSFYRLNKSQGKTMKKMKICKVGKILSPRFRKVLLRLTMFVVLKWNQSDASNRDQILCLKRVKAEQWKNEAGTFTHDWIFN